MAFNCYLGDFSTGQITRAEPLPLSRETGAVEIDIHSEDDWNISVSLPDLTQVERNDWHGTFPELRSFVVLDDDSVTWDAPGACLYAGFVNKLTPRVKPHVLDVDLTGLFEYTKARIVGEKMGQKVTDPTASITFEAATWEGVMNAVIKRMFDNTLLPADSPKNPQVLGTVGDSTGTGKKKTVLLTDAKTYGEVLREISENDSGFGIEYRFVPRWTSASKTAIVWDFITGTEVAPHINLDSIITLTLDGNSENFSSWDTTIDSNDLYSSLYLQSKAGEGTGGADFTGAALPSTDFPILVERFFNPGVELSEAEVTAQLQSRLTFAGKSKYTAGFTVEQQGNPITWLNRLGCTLNIVGVPDSISGGHSNELRCVGVSFTPGKGTVSIDVMQRQPVYPRLPKKSIGDTLSNQKPPSETRFGAGGESYTYTATQTGSNTFTFATTDNRVTRIAYYDPAPDGTFDYVLTFPPGDNYRTVSHTKPGTWDGGVTLIVLFQNDGGVEEYKRLTVMTREMGGGGALPEMPSSDWALDGDEWSNDGLWGSEGHRPGTEPKAFVNPGWEDYKAIEYTFDTHDGYFPMDVSTIFQDKGNRLYGLDKTMWAVATRDVSGTQTHYNGGLNTSTGDFLTPIPSLYIKKSYMQTDGKMGPIETLETIPESVLKTAMAEYETNNYSGDSDYKASFHFANWVVSDRYYLSISHAVNHYETSGNSLWYWNAKTIIISKKIDGSTGQLTGEWVHDTPPKVGIAPISRGIVTYGDVGAFTHNEQRPEMKMKNLSSMDYYYLGQQYLTDYGVELPDISNMRKSLIPPPCLTVGDYASGSFPGDNWYPIIQTSGPYIPYIGKNFKTGEYAPYISGGTFSPTVSAGGIGSKLNCYASNGVLVENNYALSVGPTSIGGNWKTYTSTSLVIGSNVVNGWAPVIKYNTGNNVYFESAIIKVSSLLGSQVEIRDQSDNTAFRQMAIYFDNAEKHYLGNATNYINSDGTRGPTYQYIKSSRMLSFNGRLMMVYHSAQNKLVAKSVRMIELG